MIDFTCENGTFGIAPDYCKDDPEILQWAQKWADNQSKPVHFVAWDGVIVKTVNPEV